MLNPNQNGTSGQTSYLKPVWKYWKQKIEGEVNNNEWDLETCKCPKIAKIT